MAPALALGNGELHHGGSGVGVDRQRRLKPWNSEHDDTEGDVGQVPDPAQDGTRTAEDRALRWCQEPERGRRGDREGEQVPRLEPPRAETNEPLRFGYGELQHLPARRLIEVLQVGEAQGEQERGDESRRDAQAQSQPWTPSEPKKQPREEHPSEQGPQQAEGIEPDFLGLPAARVLISDGAQAEHEVHGGEAERKHDGTAHVGEEAAGAHGRGGPCFLLDVGGLLLTRA